MSKVANVSLAIAAVALVVGVVLCGVMSAETHCASGYHRDPCAWWTWEKPIYCDAPMAGEPCAPAYWRDFGWLHW